MSELKRDLPKEAFKIEETSKLNLENEIMSKIDHVERASVKPLGMKPQMMGVLMALFFFCLALIGVLADVTTDFEGWNINGWNMQKVFGKIPVELHITLLIMSAGFLLYTMYRAVRDYSTATIKS